MRKVFPFVLSGLVALSFSQVAAAQSASSDVNKPADSGVGGPKSTDSQSTSAIGSTADVDKNTQKRQAKNKKNKNESDKDKSAAGGSSVAPGTQTGAGQSLPTKPDTSAAPPKSDNAVKSGEQSPQKSEKSD